MEKGTLIGSGRTADVYEWGQDRILKLYQAGMPAVAIEREFALTRMAGEAGLPVPATEQIVHEDGRMGIIFERIRGPSLLQVLQARPWEVFRVSRILADLHVQMHSCSLPPGNDTQHEQIERGISWAKDLSDGEKQTLLGILAGLPKGEAACHGDFHPDNVLMSERGPVIIDWMTGSRGHPHGDMARTELLFKTGGLPPRISLATRVVINASRRLIYAAYLKRYLKLQGGSRREIEAWRLPLLAARLFEVESYPREREMILRSIHMRLSKVIQMASRAPD